MKRQNGVSPFLLPLALLILTSTPTHAASRVRPHLFAGTDLGWGYVSRFAAPEGSRSGVQFDLKGLSSFYFHNFILDTGLGWQYGKRSGTDDTGGFTKTFSRGMFLEGSFRYGKPKGWQIGPSILYNFSGDIGLGANPTLGSDTPKALLAGVQIFYEIPKVDYRLRFGGRWMTDLNIKGRNVHQFQGSFEIGWPLGSSKVATVQRFNRLAGYQVITKDRATQKVKLVVDARRIEFDFDQATIRPEARARLMRLGRFLAANRDKWNALTISGHTDERGTVDYNQKLSENRARAVLDTMVEANVPRQKMKSQGFSENVPIDPGHNEYAWQRNRRVEFEFTGVKDMDLIIDGVNQATDDEHPTDASDEQPVEN